MQTLGAVAWLLFFSTMTHEGPDHSISAGDDMLRAARYFMNTFSPDAQKSMTFDMNDEERQNWHYFPKDREGVSFKDMTPAQEKMAYAFLSSGLSREGYQKALNIMFLDQILHERQNQNPIRNPDLYYFTLFGEPGLDTPWGWRVEGHHLSLNFTLADGQLVSTTPLFMGSDPAEVKEGPMRGLRALSPEETLGRELARSLTAEQRATAFLSEDAPAEILTRAERKVGPLEPKGLPVSQMDETQAGLFFHLLGTYVHRVREDAAEEIMKKMRETDRASLYFAWAGGLEPGQGHYYRVQGPAFVMEYDNTQNHANHVHTVWRDFENDFGVDWLQRHYLQSHRRP